MGSTRRPPRLEVALAIPALKLWEPAVAGVLGVDGALASAVASALNETGITVVRDRRFPRFVATRGTDRVTCGRRRAQARTDNDERTLVLSFRLEAGSGGQTLELLAEGRGRASIVNQSLGIEFPTGPEPRAAGSVQFAGDMLAARDRVISSALGLRGESTRAWVGELLAAREIVVVTVATRPTWHCRRGALTGEFEHGGHSVSVDTIEELPSGLRVSVRTGVRTELALLLYPRPFGGVEIVSDGFGYRFELGDPARWN